MGDDDSTRLEERVADENAEHPYEELELQTSLNLLTQLLSKLNPRESRILRYRFGLDGERERTLEEVGQVRRHPRTHPSTPEYCAEPSETHDGQAKRSRHLSASKRSCSGTSFRLTHWNDWVTQLGTIHMKAPLFWKGAFFFGIIGADN